MTRAPAAGRTESRCGLAGRPFQLPRGQDVHVQMRDGLSGIGAVIDNETKAGFITTQAAGNFACGQHHVAQEGGIPFIGQGQTRNGLAGNEQQMRGSLGTDVPEADALIVLIDNVRRNFPGSNYFKQRGRHGIKKKSSGCLSFCRELEQIIPWRRRPGAGGP